MKNDHFDATPVAILVPKANGYFTAISFKSYLLGLGVHEVNVIEAQPCQLKRVEIPATTTTLYIGGLGLKNCSPKDLSAFIKKYQDIIAFWADNHPIREEIKEMTTSDLRCLYFDALDDKAPSCTALLNQLWGDKIVKPEWVLAANHLENPTKNTEHKLATEFKKLMFVAKTEDDSGHSAYFTEEMKAMYAKHLLSGGAYRNEIQYYLKKYDKIMHATHKAAQNIVQLHPDKPGIFVTNPGQPEQVEKDRISAEATRLAAKHIIAIQHFNLKEEPITTVLSAQVNLLPLFAGYAPGAKEVSRIYLPGNHSEVLHLNVDRLEKTGFSNEKN